MKIKFSHLVFFILFVGIQLNAQQIKYSYFTTSYDGLKEYLFSQKDYLNGGKTKNPYFQGVYSSNYIKFNDNGMNNVSFDVRSSSEFLALTNVIKSEANFRYKYCTSSDEPIVYCYVTQNGNIIRYNLDKARINVEYQSGLSSFFEENKGLTTAFVCLGNDAYAYHTNLKCTGLNNCESDIVKTTFNDARTHNYKICEICTDNSDVMEKYQGTVVADSQIYLPKEDSDVLSDKQINIMT